MTIRNYGLCTDLAELSELVDGIIARGGPFGFDIETGYTGPDREKFSLHPETAIVVGISFTDSLDWARYVPLAHEEGENVDNHAAAEIFWRLLSTGSGVAHNVGFELKHLSRWFAKQLHYVADVRQSKGYFPVRSCTQVEAYLVAETPFFGLKPLTEAFCDHKMTELHELFPDLTANKRKYLRFNVLDQHDPAVVAYACEDSLWCLAHHFRNYDRVKDMGLYKVEMAIMTKVVPAMEDAGVCYDWLKFSRVAAELEIFKDRYNAEIMSELSEAIGRPMAVNLGSPKQVSRLLYEQLGFYTSVFTAATRDLPPSERKMSTGAIAMAGLAKKHSIVGKILAWREQTKLLGSYLNKYEKAYNYAEDGHAHPNHLSAFVVTGRFALSDPNYQQCLPGSYQVLTVDGWVRLDELADGQQIFQYHNNGWLSLTTPHEVVRAPNREDMIEINDRSNGTWQYTPEHRIVYRWYGKGRKRATTAMQSATHRRTTSVEESTAEAWETHLLNQGAREDKTHKISNRIIPISGLRQGGRRLSLEERDSLVRAANWYKSAKRTVPPEHSYWLDETKNFRARSILELCAEDLEFFLHASMNADSHASLGHRRPARYKPTADIQQAAAHLIGWSTKPGRDTFNPTNTKLNFKRARMHRDVGFSWTRRVPGPDTVYCVMVDTEMFLVRNDEGRVIVTGNSPKKYHFDLAEARAVHAEHAEAHGKKCTCDDPQYIPPAGTCFKFNFRDCIVAPPGHYMLGFDLSQAELRAIAGEANEEALIRAFNTGVDVHTATASLMLGIPIEEITDDQRQIGKMLNFALGYGMGAKGLADRLGISLSEAKALYRKYFAIYAGIAVWTERQVRIGKSQGYVTSKFGRKLPIWEYTSDKDYIRQKGDRACVNYPIQGSATGDYMKIAMVRAHAAIRDAGLEDKVWLVMNVHDALEFYVHGSVDPQTVIRLLQPAVVFPVPGWPQMKADWHVAKKWGSPTNLEVAPDGTILKFGGVPYVEDDKPEFIQDEETGEEIGVLPEIDTATLRQSLHGADALPEAERDIVVHILDMPTQSAWNSFCGWLGGRPGPHRVTVRVPEGELTFEETRHRISLDDLGALSAILGPVELCWADDIQADVIMADIEL